ncbi:MAG: CDP-diacylglycerol--glycerol-3-phosphate 3-phosphatidyltransferase [Coxiellaceae bacterium]|jgi:CDP-diacylglycerol--glycerol-3-phosphate 3-phosphatidyltransferase|nr:CDP-diacylglycerol--glycerol-3-phosphate 3-phosphatidyltransferase [Coxiellaceae bacterium]
MKKNIPNLLTLIRIFLIPAIVLAFYLPGKFGHVLATFIFAVAALTDLFDGLLARNLNQTTRFGAFLDPVADKLIVSIALILIVAELGKAYVAIPAVVIVGREIAISALREWMADIGKRTSVAVSYMTRIKTTVQMFAVGLLLLYCPKCADGYKHLVLGLVLLYVAVGMTLWSMYIYLKAAWPDLMKGD